MTGFWPKMMICPECVGVLTLGWLPGLPARCTGLSQTSRGPACACKGSLPSWERNLIPEGWDPPGMSFLASGGLLPGQRITDCRKCVFSVFSVCFVRLQCKWRLVLSISLVTMLFITHNSSTSTSFSPGCLPSIGNLTHPEWNGFLRKAGVFPVQEKLVLIHCFSFTENATALPFFSCCSFWTVLAPWKYAPLQNSCWEIPIDHKVCHCLWQTNNNTRQGWE